MVSTWQIFSDAGDNFRWEISPIEKSSHHHAPLDASSPSPSPLPSFHDVLLQGCSKILGDSENQNVKDVTPMFRTGLGSTVALNKSSIAKASSVLGDDFIANFDSGKPCFKGYEFTSPNSMFQTGSGKAVNLSSAGLLRARALLGGDENDNDCAFQSFEPAKKKSCRAHMTLDEKGVHVEKRQIMINSVDNENNTFCSKLPIQMKNDSSETKSSDEGIGKLVHPGLTDSTTKLSAIKFHTAGGRFISVSSDALQRARNLLGDLEMDSLSNEGDSGASIFSFMKHDNAFVNSFDKENKLHAFHQLEKSPKIFVSPLKPSSSRKPLEARSETLISGTNLIRKFDAEANICNLNGSGFHKFSKPSGMPLLDITNSEGINSTTKKGKTTELKRLGRKSSVSPFIMPRSSKFITPLNCNHSSTPNGFPSREAPLPRKKVCTRYPFQRSRLYVRDFFRVPPTYPEKLARIPEEILQVNPQNSEKYTFVDGSQSIGVEAFYHMLLESGAAAQHSSKQWVANHYKWIVWKLASYERCYSLQFMKKFLTAFNVLEELKYRYEREVNHGQRSAIKRILEGDAPPSSTLVLCISAIKSPSSSLVGYNSSATIELTDGWYSVCAQLDLLLSKQLAEGKLFVGQKLRICGASLNGWNGPVSPLEASFATSTVSLLLHMNGTCRASWHERLGFCRGSCTPLAFRCIKDNGGPVPLTLVGVKRIYPVLYRERLRTGGCVVRSEKMETSLTHQYNQRRSNIVEGITSDLHKGPIGSCIENDYDNEGAKILKMLETAAEPELLMAEMSSEQLASFSKYRTKVEENRQCNLQRLIEKALEDAGLSARDVTPFMRLRVVALKNKSQCEGDVLREGLITIWSPTEQQKLELEEGHAYAISGLSPLHSDLNILYLTARGSSTKWKALTPKETEFYVPFFEPRKAVSLCKLEEVHLSSEFDTTVLILHVGDQYVSGQQKRQWVFVTDGSLSDLQAEESAVSLLAINFCSHITEDDSISPINYNLVGSIVGFCNIVKRAKDPVNNMWVADAIENSAYYLNYDHLYCSHLKDAFSLVKNWEQSASSTIEKLREKVMHIIRGPDPKG